MKRFMKWTLIALALVACLVSPSGRMGVMVFGTVVSAAGLVALQKNFNALFNQALEALQPKWPAFAMKVNSEGASEDYQWLGDTPMMREWLGDKFVKDIRGFTFSVPNKDFEVTIGVRRNDIEDDRLGKYAILIPQMADEGTYKQDTLITDLRIAGTSTLCYDGNDFYATNHNTGKSGNQSNLLTGTGHTLAQVTADLMTARTTLRRYLTDQGKPFIRTPGKLQVLCTIPPDLEGVFELLYNANIILQTDNLLKGAFPYQVDSYLTDTDDWYLDYVGNRIRPFVLQMRKEPHLVMLNDPQSESVFTRAEYQFSNEARFNAAFGLWPYSIKVSNT
ncbi:MAG: Mu-like prophage major head subunit gpT family protein [Bacteroidota bacterium]|jgi:phage major head subunit gpT-like protein